MATSVHTVAPRTWVNGEIVTVSMMNTEVRDAMLDMEAGWDAYTPTWTGSSTNPTLGNGTLTGAVRQIGKTVWFRAALTMGSTSTYGSGGFQLSLPVAMTGVYLVNAPLGDAVCYDVSAGQVYPRTVIRATTTACQIFGTAADRVTSAVPFTWAVGDTLQVLGCYEAA